MGLEILDVVIGLVFMYVLLSLTCTTLNELLAQWQNSRAVTLEQGIRNLFTGGSGPILTSTEALKRRETAWKAVCDAWPRSAANDQRLFKDLDDIERQTINAIDDELGGREAYEVANAKLETATLSADAERIKQTAIEFAGAESYLRDASRKADTVRRTVAILTRALCAGTALTGKSRRALAKWQRAQREEERARAGLLIARFYDHPIIAALAQERRRTWRVWQHEETPAYIPVSAFSTAFFDVIAPAPAGASIVELRSAVGRLPEQVGRPLLLFLNGAGDDLASVRTSVETWYEDTMARVSGLYKRKSQVSVLLLAAGITLVSNADTIRMARALGDSDALRAAVVAQAKALADMSPASLGIISGTSVVETGAMTDTAPDTKSDTKSDTPVDTFADKPLAPPLPDIASQPTGQSQPTPPGDTAKRAAQGANSEAARAAGRRIAEIRSSLDSIRTFGVPLGWHGPVTLGAVLLALPGLLLTTLAVSLGAPFWFDMLNKVVNIRSSGRAPEEGPKSPEQLPKAKSA